MLYYRDSVIVIYAVEGNPADQQRAQSRLAALEQAGHRFAISELTRTECLVRASAIRGGYTYPAIPPAPPRRYGLADALHLAIAIESGRGC